MRINLIKPQVVELSPAKVRLIARLKSDGCTFVAGRTNYYLKFDSKSEQELDVFSQDIEEVYGLKTKKGFKISGKNTNKIVKSAFIRSKLAFEDMQKYGPFYSANWRVPTQIQESTKELKREFLRIFAEDEGTVLTNNREVRIYSINEGGLKQLQSMLKEFEIESKMQKGYGLKRNVFGLIIRGKENLIKFRDFIGFRSERKVRKLDELVSCFKR